MRYKTRTDRELVWFVTCTKKDLEEVSMSKKLSLWFSTATLVLALALLGGCQQPTESAEADDAAEAGEAEPGQATAEAPRGSGGQASQPSGGDSRASAPPAAPAPRQLTLPAGSTLKVRTTNTLSTKTVQAGETFTASLEEPIVDGAWVAANKGATVYGKIVNADPGGRVKGTASLTVRLTELQTSGGQRIAINSDTYGVSAQSTKKKDAVKVGIASGVGAAIGAIAGGGDGAAKGAGIGAGAGTGAVLATRGDPAVIPSESVLTFSLNEAVTITQQ
jgi:hypothetical protein